MTLTTRQPTGQATPPLILLEGPELSGKSWAAAVLSGSERIGRAFWIPFGTATADAYGAVPGAAYEVVVHDGTYDALLDAVTEVRAVAQQAKAEGDRPVLLVLDAVTAEWELLKAYANNRAKGSTASRQQLAADPHAEIVIPSCIWDDVNDRHGRLMNLLRTFPGVAIMIARGREVAAFGENGQLIEGRTAYRVEAQKSVPGDATCWVRLSRDEPGTIIGCRSASNPVRPGVDLPVRLPDDWTLEWLVFDYLQYEPAGSRVPDLALPRPERTAEQIRDEAFQPGMTPGRLRELYQDARRFGVHGAVVQNENRRDEVLQDLIVRGGRELEAQAEERRAKTVAQERLVHMESLWRDAADFEDPAARAAFTAEIVGRPVTAETPLTEPEVAQVRARLAAYIEQNTQPDSHPGGPELEGTDPDDPSADGPSPDNDPRDDEPAEGVAADGAEHEMAGAV